MFLDGVGDGKKNVGRFCTLGNSVWEVGQGKAVWIQEIKNFGWRRITLKRRQLEVEHRSQGGWDGTHESPVDLETGPTVGRSNCLSVIANHFLGCFGHLGCKCFCLQEKLKILQCTPTALPS